MTVLVRLLLIVIASGFAQGASAVDTKDPVLEELFGDPSDARPSAPEPIWRPDLGTVVWIDDTETASPMLMEFDPATGERRILLHEQRLTAAWGERPGAAPILEDPVWRPDGEALLVLAGDDPFLFDLAEGSLTAFKSGAGVEQDHHFSPDGRRIAWVRDNDLWVYDLVAGLETRLSHDGSATVFNGIFDWVYEEELAGRKSRAFEWAADGSAIAWLRLDDGSLPVHHLVDLMATHSTIDEQRYPTPGDPPPQASLHLARFDELTGQTVVKTIAFEGPDGYIPRFGFTPDGHLWYQLLDRSQKHTQLIRVDHDNNTSTPLVEETDFYWTEPVDGVHFFADGSFLWLSRRDGFTHLYRVRPGGEAVDLSPGSWDVTEIVGVDSDARFAWYQAARPSPMERRLYRVDLGTGKTSEVTPSAGTHSGQLAPSGSLLVTTSTFDAPPRTRVVDGLGMKAAAVPVEHPVPNIGYGDHRFVEIETEDGVTLNALLLVPPDFDESRLYPVVVYTYGGPHAQVALNMWPRTSGLFNHALVSRGFVVFALDNRGSAARGREFEGAASRSLGSKQLPDQLAGVTWLRAQPWVNPDRIGIWGWSYGGYMTAFALTHAPGIFAAGAAVAPVTDWRLYDSIYTERYMGTPESNPAGYSAGSVLDAVGALEDPLLVIHGTGDDNVHVQHSLQLADRAWREGVRFDLMLLPNLGHGINAPGSHLQVFSAIADFFERHLMKEGETER